MPQQLVQRKQVDMHLGNAQPLTMNTQQQIEVRSNAATAGWIFQYWHTMG
jgi:ribosomal protein L6P/L9E